MSLIRKTRTSRLASCYTPGRWRPDRYQIERLSIPTADPPEDGSPARGPCKIGQAVDGCRIVSVLGQGGMATVYLAYRPASRAFVALKVMHPSCAGQKHLRQYFEHEGDCLRRLHGPYTPALVGQGQMSGTGLPYMVTAFSAGDQLNRMLGKDERLRSVKGAVEIGLQLAATFGAMHDRGIVHRDLKQENVIVRGGRRLRCRLIDFGLARPHLPGRRTPFCGTPLTISPQQARGEDADPRDDLYALGVLLYETLAGGCNPAADGNREININFDDYLEAIAEERLPFIHLAKRQPDLPQALCNIVMRLLWFRREGRYANAWQLGTDLLPFAPAAARADFIRLRQRARGTRSLRRAKPPAKR